MSDLLVLLVHVADEVVGLVGRDLHGLCLGGVEVNDPGLLMVEPDDGMKM